MEAETLLQKHKLFSEDVSTHTPIYHATIKFGDELIGKLGVWGPQGWGLGQCPYTRRGRSSVGGKAS